MKVIGFIGSNRKRGNTSTLVQESLKAIENEGIETELIYLSDYEIKGCTGCEGCKKTFKCIIDDDMQKLYPALLEADGIILGSPTYFYNMSAKVKAFIERCYCHEIFSDDDRSVWVSLNEALGGKVAVTIAVSEQKKIEDMGVTSEAMDMSLVSLGYRIVESVKVLHLYNPNEAKENVESMEQAKLAGIKLSKTLKLKKSTLDKLKSTQK